MFVLYCNLIYPFMLDEAVFYRNLVYQITEAFGFGVVGAVEVVGYH